MQTPQMVNRDCRYMVGQIVELAMDTTKLSDWKFEQGIDQDYDKGTPKFSSPDFSRVSLVLNDLTLEVRRRAPCIETGHTSDDYHFLIRKSDSGEVVCFNILSENAMGLYEKLSKPTHGLDQLAAMVKDLAQRSTKPD